MTDTYDEPIPADQAAEIESSIRDLADRFRPENPARPPTFGRPGLETPTASLIGKRLEQAIETAKELEKTATVLALAICGPNQEVRSGNKAAPAPDFLFGRQAAALDELQAVHGRIRSVLERIGAALR